LKHKDLINLAINVAISGDDYRNHRIGAVAIRNDGAIVVARNGSTGGWRIPEAHAEFRLSKKLDANSTVYVVRVRQDGSLGMAKPCPICMQILISRSVSRILFTNNNGILESV
jgi:tRNA(Arg) A34 adenosine deaminase TadA